MIYFASSGDRIKIGTSTNVDARLADVGAHLDAPLVLIGTVDGSYRYENAIHRHLVGYRIKGEWFLDCEPVRSCLDGLMKEGPSHIGYTQPVAQLTANEKKQQYYASAEYKAKRFGIIARMIWPDTALQELCALSGANESTVARWLNGIDHPPRIVRLAFGAILTSFICPDGETLSFINCDPDDIRRIPNSEREDA